MIWRISRRSSIITWQGYRVSASRLAESNFRYTQLYPRLLYRCTAAPLHRDPAKERWFSLLLPARLSRETPFQIIEISWISAGLRCPPPCILRKSPCISPNCRERDRFDGGCIHHHAFTFSADMWRRAENAHERRAFPMRPSSLSFSGRSDGRFRASVSAAKNPVPGAEKVWWRELRPGAVAAECALRLKSVNVKKWNQCRARPSRSNCSDHSAGASRKVATPMLRGSRPSTAALTRAGAMNAIDIVMLT